MWNKRLMWSWSHVQTEENKNKNILFVSRECLSESQVAREMIHSDQILIYFPFLVELCIGQSLEIFQNRTGVRFSSMMDVQLLRMRRVLRLESCDTDINLHHVSSEEPAETFSFFCCFSDEGSDHKRNFCDAKQPTPWHSHLHVSV